MKITGITSDGQEFSLTSHRILEILPDRILTETGPLLFRNWDHWATAEGKPPVFVKVKVETAEVPAAKPASAPAKK